MSYINLDTLCISHDNGKTISCVSLFDRKKSTQISTVYYLSDKALIYYSDIDRSICIKYFKSTEKWINLTDLLPKHYKIVSIQQTKSDIYANVLDDHDRFEQYSRYNYRVIKVNLTGEKAEIVTNACEAKCREISSSFAIKNNDGSILIFNENPDSKPIYYKLNNVYNEWDFDPLNNKLAFYDDDHVIIVDIATKQKVIINKKSIGIYFEPNDKELWVICLEPIFSYSGSVFSYNYQGDMVGKLINFNHHIIPPIIHLTNYQYEFLKSISK